MMSERFESDTGLVWNVQRESIRLGGTRAEKLTCIRIRKLPDDGRFVDEMKEAHPEVGLIDFILDEQGSAEPVVDLSSLGQLGNLKVISLQTSNQVLREDPGPVHKLPIERVISTYVDGVTEHLVRGAELKTLVLEGAPIGILRKASDALRMVELNRMQQSNDPSAWDKLSALDEFSVECSGTVCVFPPATQWPEIVSFTSVVSIKDIVKASQVLPFRFLYLEGIRSFDSGANFWDLKAHRVTVGFATKPPKWMVDAWPMRPANWADWFVIPYHPSLPGSEDAIREEFDSAGNSG